jgi:hypothetical protein
MKMAIDDRGGRRDDAFPELRYMRDERRDAARATRDGLLILFAVGGAALTCLLLWKRGK